MDFLYTSQKHFYFSLLLLFLFMGSCNQSKKSDAATQNVDTLSVKKLTPDSSSHMPIAQPKDSTERILNPYDSAKN